MNQPTNSIEAHNFRHVSKGHPCSIVTFPYDLVGENTYDLSDLSAQGQNAPEVLSHILGAIASFEEPLPHVVVHGSKVQIDGMSVYASQGAGKGLISAIHTAVCTMRNVALQDREVTLNITEATKLHGV